MTPHFLNAILKSPWETTS